MNSTCYNRSSANNNTTLQPPVSGLDEYSRFILIVLQLTLHTFTFVGGFIGNVFIPIIIYRRKKMQTITNLFVFNLAISDLAIVLIVIPTANIFPYVNSPFGELGCRYVYPIFEHFAGVCVFTHTLLSLARCLIVNSGRNIQNVKKKHVIAIILGIWVVALLTFSLPLMGIVGHFQMVATSANLLQCHLSWVSVERKLAFMIVLFLLTYVTPMVVTGVSYTKIHIAVSKSIKNLYGHISDTMLSSRRRKSRQMDRLLMTMYLMFGITTLPLQVLYLMSGVGLIPLSFSVSFGGRVMFALFLALFYAQVVSNPLVLFYMGEEYRRELYKLSVCCCIKNPRFRRLSYVVKGSFRGSFIDYKQRKSVSSVRRASGKSRAISKGTLLIREETVNSMKSAKGENNINYDILQTVEPKTEDINDKQQNLIICSDTPKSSATNSQISTDSSTLSKYDNSQNVSHTCVENKLVNIDNDSSNLKSSKTIESENIERLNEVSKRCNDRLLENSVESNISTKSRMTKERSTTSCTESSSADNKQNSSPDDRTLTEDSKKRLPSAYYDDGTLMYFYDEILGKISLQFDSGRETAC